jgi:hypothetical protein
LHGYLFLEVVVALKRTVGFVGCLDLSGFLQIETLEVAVFAVAAKQSG